MENSQDESHLDQSLLPNRQRSISGNPVQRNVMEGVEDARARSGKLMALYALYAVIELTVTSTILSLYWDQPCDQPIKYFTLVFSLRFVIALPLNVYRYRHPHDSPRTKRVITWVDIGYLGWFVFGQIWTFRSATCAETSPEVFYYALALIIITYFVLLLPVLLVLGLCLCLPCVFIVLGCLSENQGADDKEISNIPTREFTKEDDPGECSICMTEFEEGDTISELPCSHRFHEACVNRWLPIKRTCPLCRHDITQEADPPVGGGAAAANGGDGAADGVSSSSSSSANSSSSNLNGGVSSSSSSSASPSPSSSRPKIEVLDHHDGDEVIVPIGLGRSRTHEHRGIV